MLENVSLILAGLHHENSSETHASVLLLKCLLGVGLQCCVNSMTSIHSKVIAEETWELDTGIKRITNAGAQSASGLGVVCSALNRGIMCSVLDTGIRC